MANVVMVPTMSPQVSMSVSTAYSPVVQAILNVYTGESGENRLAIELTEASAMTIMRALFEMGTPIPEEIRRACSVGVDTLEHAFDVAGRGSVTEEVRWDGW